VPHILSQLPATLDETYVRVLKEIGANNQFYAHRLLQCLTVAKRPLRVWELAEILALDFATKEGIPELKENWRWIDEQEAVLSTCSSLIAVVDGNFVQFSHFSVKEFLTSDRLATSSADISRFHILPEPAHTVIVKACLGILLQSKQDASSAKVEHRSPLARYAAEHWTDHARFEKVWTHVEDGIRCLFDSAKAHLEAWLRLSRTQTRSQNRIKAFAGYDLINHHGSPLYYASLCGFCDLAALLITSHPQHVTGLVGRNPTPLMAALQGRHFDIAELLYQAGADLGIRVHSNMTLLHAVLEEGLVDIAKWLFNHGVPDISQKYGYETPSHLAEENERRGHGIAVNDADDHNNTLLHLASQCGHLEIVQELLMRGADVTTRDRRHRTPLHLASNYTVSAKLRHSW
jgi:ankyrin repeat protein